jgi:hypothetical protein
VERFNQVGHANLKFIIFKVLILVESQENDVIFIHDYFDFLNFFIPPERSLKLHTFLVNSFEKCQ